MTLMNLHYLKSLFSIFFLLFYFTMFAFWHQNRPAMPHQITYQFREITLYYKKRKLANNDFWAYQKYNRYLCVVDVYYLHRVIWANVYLKLDLNSHTPLRFWGILFWKIWKNLDIPNMAYVDFNAISVRFGPILLCQHSGFILASKQV